MEIQFKFNYDNTDLSYFIVIPEDELPNNIARLSSVVGEMVKATGGLYEYINRLPAYDPPEDIGDDEFGDDVNFTEEYEDGYCNVCQRYFKGPSALKQHKTVMGHNGQ